jgi:hypothetical protein
MIITVDLHLRSSQRDEHHNMGLMAVELDETDLAPHQDLAFASGGRLVRAHITSIRQQGDHLPHVYADEVHADEEVH